MKPITIVAKYLSVIIPICPHPATMALNSANFEPPRGKTNNVVSEQV